MATTQTKGRASDPPPPDTLEGKGPIKMSEDKPVVPEPEGRSIPGAHTSMHTPIGVPTDQPDSGPSHLNPVRPDDAGFIFGTDEDIKARTGSAEPGSIVSGPGAVKAEE